MSGGHFDYHQYKMGEIADSIEEEIKNNYKEYDYSLDVYLDSDTPRYSPAVIEEFEKAISIIRTAEVYAQRIDWLISGDDNEKSFFERLEFELNQLNNGR